MTSADGPTLADFRAPAEAGGMQAEFAQRDIDLEPAKSLAAWRGEIDALLANGPPYGKSIFIGEVNPIWEAFGRWRAALENLPPDASPYAVYACAPVAALTFLGY